MNGKQQQASLWRETESYTGLDEVCTDWRRSWGSVFCVIYGVMFFSSTIKLLSSVVFHWSGSLDQNKTKQKQPIENEYSSSNQCSNNSHLNWAVGVLNACFLETYWYVCQLTSVVSTCFSNVSPSAQEVLGGKNTEQELIASESWTSLSVCLKGYHFELSVSL